MIEIMSFGYKHGEPEGYKVIDCRSIKNPYTVEKFKGKTWEDAELQDYVIGDPLSGQKLWAAKDLIDVGITKIAFGCVGGQHRSVILAELLASNLHDLPWEITHRDLREQ